VRGQGRSPTAWYTRFGLLNRLQRFPSVSVSVSENQNGS
jgi:hypothetical protein